MTTRTICDRPGCNHDADQAVCIQIGLSPRVFRLCNVDVKHFKDTMHLFFGKAAVVADEDLSGK